MTDRNTAIMLDLETLSSGSGAAITQIAAVSFDIDTGETFGHINSYVRTGFGVCSRDTALWWMQQPSALAFAKLVQTQGVDLRAALGSLTDWLKRHAQWPLYAHGGAFDFPVLRAAYEAYQMVPPWSYRDECCTRTLYKELSGGSAPEVPRDDELGPAHDALSDCYHQIKQLVAARRELRLAEYVQ